MTTSLTRGQRDLAEKRAREKKKVPKVPRPRERRRKSREKNSIKVVIERAALKGQHETNETGY